ncbi:MAG: fumarylacetoacetate hydrolase family protein [Methanosarcinales archaeon]|nr:fumarylacetoacetate hydrolase family protein [Methanosarcinales archaeon]
MMVKFRAEGRVLEGTLEGETVEGQGRSYRLEEVELLAPCSPSKVVCVGLNYREHARELKMEIPGEPIIFLKPPSSVVGPGADIVMPGSSSQVDYEGELGMVIGRRCKDVPADEAGAYILGFTCFNDVTARDLQRKDGQWTRAKSFDTFAPLGPGIVPLSLKEAGSARIQTRVDGQVRQDSSTSDLIFSLPRLLEFISGIMTLERGDVIATGTPPGVGPLKRGETVEVEIQGIGILCNRTV